MVLRWKILAKDTVGKQLIRSADSIGANIAEGSGRASKTENRRYARIARGSLYETKHWLRRAFKRKLMSPDEIQRMSQVVEELTRVLNGYLRALD